MVDGEEVEGKTVERNGKVKGKGGYVRGCLTLRICDGLVFDLAFAYMLRDNESNDDSGFRTIVNE